MYLYGLRLEFGSRDIRYRSVLTFPVLLMQALLFLTGVVLLCAGRKFWDVLVSIARVRHRNVPNQKFCVTGLHYRVSRWRLGNA